MSHKLMIAVSKLALALTGGERNVLNMLCWLAHQPRENANGTTWDEGLASCAWPAMSTLAMMTGMSTRQVQRAVRHLHALGLLDDEGVHDTAGTRVWLVDLAAIEAFAHSVHKPRKRRAPTTTRHPTPDTMSPPPPTPCHPPPDTVSEGGDTASADLQDRQEINKKGSTVDRVRRSSIACTMTIDEQPTGLEYPPLQTGSVDDSSEVNKSDALENNIRPVEAADRQKSATSSTAGLPIGLAARQQAVLQSQYPNASIALALQSAALAFATSVPTPSELFSFVERHMESQKP